MLTLKDSGGAGRIRGSHLQSSQNHDIRGSSTILLLERGHMMKRRKSSWLQRSHKQNSERQELQNYRHWFVIEPVLKQLKVAPSG